MLRSPSLAGDLFVWAARSLGAFFPQLPRHRVQPGESWERVSTVPMDGEGELELVTSGRLVGVDAGHPSAQHRLARLATKGSIRLIEPRDDAELKAFRLTYSGTVQFDVERGAVVELKREGQLRMKRRTNNLLMEVRVRFTSILQRVAAP